jgi:hypothetical protein
MTLIDYAAPMMQIEKLLKDMHNDLLEKRYQTAHEKTFALVAECRVLSHTILIMKEQEDALRKQTAPVQEGVPATDQAWGNPGQAGAPTRTPRFGQTRY